MRNNILAMLAVASCCPAFAQQYQVVVTTKDGEKTVFATSDVGSIKFEEAPSYLECDNFVEGVYRLSGTNGLYEVSVATGSVDADGMPTEIGDLQLSLALIGAASEDSYDAILPAGYYRAAAGVTNGPNTWDVQKSTAWIRLGESEDDILQLFLIGGTVDVRHTAPGQYDMRAELSTLDGTQVAVRYQGEMNFIAGASVSNDFTEDQDITFEGAQGRFYGNWFYPFADDVTVQIYTGTFDEWGTQTEGYWLNLDMYQPKVEDPINYKPARLIDGVYTAEWREEVPSYTYIPYTFGRGREIDMWGTVSPTGTYLMYLGADGRRQLAYLTEGTYTVSNNGTHIEFDMVAENGIHLTGSYDGTPDIRNFCDNDFPGIDTADTLTENVDLTFTPTTICADYIMGETIAKGLVQHTLLIIDQDSDKGDYLWLDLFTEGKPLAEGTYTLNNEFKAFTGLTGFIDYGMSPSYSWYGDLGAVEIDPETGELYNTVMAPLGGGTVTVSYPEGIGEGYSKVNLEFNLVSAKGYSITGEWEGYMMTVDPEPAAAATSKMKTRMPRAKRVPGVHGAHKDVISAGRLMKR
ncbi:MAG: hypothetical protein HDS13_02690 [Bacteroides sp.]|nr:hypothetical protein [Bacteroides sp.]